MNIKSWLIKKLGGITLEDIPIQEKFIYQYQQLHVFTYYATLRVDYKIPIAEAVIKEKLAQQFLNVVKQNMEVESMDIPKLGVKEYIAKIRIAEKE